MSRLQSFDGLHRKFRTNGLLWFWVAQRFNGCDHTFLICGGFSLGGAVKC
jgi:hypothetical protein